MERGLDISGHQLVTNTTLLSRLSDPKYTFIIGKASEGQGVKDSKYLQHKTNALAKGKKWGAYHFAWPNQNPLLEAANFIAAAQLTEGQVACLDLENWSSSDPTVMANTSWATRINYALTWLAEVETKTGAHPFLYMNWDWIKNFRSASTTAQWAKLTSYPLWLADYDSGVPGTFPTVNPKVAGGPTFTVVLHQWTSNEGGLDGDALMDPVAWSTNAVPKKELFTVGQYEDLMGALTALNTRVSGIEANVTKLVNDTNVATMSANMTQRLSALSDQLTGVNQSLGEAVTNISVSMDGDVEEAVKSALSGFAVTMKFPGGTA